MSAVQSLVLLHGWGGDCRLWQPLLEVLQPGLAIPVMCLELPGFGARSADSWPEDPLLDESVLAQLPADCVLVGHSLGGMLATRLAASAGESRIRGVITIAANATFLQRDDWPGMAETTFDEFRRALATDGPRTWRRFCGLQASGDGASRQLLSQLRQWRPPAVGAAWAGALQSLGRWDNRPLLRVAEGLPVPGLHIYGERDALVPVAAATQLQSHGAAVELLPGCGHTPHISRPERVATLVEGFLGSIGQPGAEDSHLPQKAPFAKGAVARSFGRAAKNYDAAAHLQRAVCRQLMAGVGTGWQPERILDLGSGTGYGSAGLRQRFPRAEIIALDIAEDMLRLARTQRPAADFHVGGDAEQLPLADGSVDLIFSNMALQWCCNLERLFAELRRVMAPGGLCLVSTLGPGTLSELKHSWAQVDGGVHVNRFSSREEWLGAASAAGLAGGLHNEQRLLHFASALQLMRELKSIGAGNVNRAAGRGLTSRAKLQKVLDAYENFRTGAGLPASYDIYYLNLRAQSAGAVGSALSGGIEQAAPQG
ncbi:malonyl-ACP O-methyltransferase BioC [Microbulbifer sp. TYP-18]|uniref:malonyl-ACP O-methyltransferase BioC n=1 Tax=Microbulbifer sp. TYP-18 TaxID=3230024 RepID=UPI0034C5B452